jgi:hypothetical protein
VSPPTVVTVEVQVNVPVQGVLTWLRHGAVLRTDATGRVRVPLNLVVLGRVPVRAVVVQTGTPVTSVPRIIRVHPGEPLIVGGVRDVGGVNLQAMQYAFCVGVARTITVFAPVSPPAYGAAVKFAGAAYQASACDQKSFAASVWAGLSAALKEYVLGKPVDVAMEKVWGPVFERLLALVGTEARGVVDAARGFFNDRISTMLREVGDSYAACLRAVGTEAGWPGRVLQCTLRNRAAQTPLNAARL